jgi:hypothetical protein
MTRRHRIRVARLLRRAASRLDPAPEPPPQTYTTSMGTWGNVTPTVVHWTRPR